MFRLVGYIEDHWKPFFYLCWLLVLGAGLLGTVSDRLSALGDFFKPTECRMARDFFARQGVFPQPS